MRYAFGLYRIIVPFIVVESWHYSLSMWRAEVHLYFMSLIAEMIKVVLDTVLLSCMNKLST